MLRAEALGERHPIRLPLLRMTLEDDPFAYRITKDGRVLVSRGGRLIVTVAGAAADRLLAQLGTDDDLDQQLLARATGNYRRGNERR
jgi:hypothetical protein